MEAQVSQFLSDHLGLTEGFSEKAGPIVWAVLLWLVGVVTPWIKRRSGKAAYRIGGVVFAPFVSQPSPALDAFLTAIAAEDVRYQKFTRVVAQKSEDVWKLLAGKFVVEFNSDQMIGGVKEILGEGDAPLLPLLESHEQEWAKKAAVTRRREVIERDRQEANASFASRNTTAKAA